MSDATPHILVTLDGVEHPIRMDEITARQVELVQRAFDVNPAAFEVMIKTEAATFKATKVAGSIVGPPQIAALVYLSRLQSEGVTVSAEAIKDSVTLGTPTEIRVLRSFTRSEVALLDPPA